MRTLNALRSIRNSLSPNPEPSDDLVERLRQFDTLIFILRQRTHDRFQTLFSQLKDTNIPITSTWIAEETTDDDIMPDTRRAFACVEPTIIRRPFTIFNCIRELRLRHQERGIVTSALITPHRSHSEYKSNGRPKPLHGGYEELRKQLDNWNVHQIDTTAKRPIDMLQESVMHHTA